MGTQGMISDRTTDYREANTEHRTPNTEWGRRARRWNTRAVSEMRNIQLSTSKLLQLVGFYQRDPGSAILSAHNRGVIAGREGSDDGRFVIVGRWKQGGFDSCWRVILPVVVEGQ